MKKTFVTLAACVFTVTAFCQEMKQLIDENMRFGVQQYKLLMTQVPADVMPRSFDAANGKLITSNTKWWCSGFYPGTLLYLYEYTKDSVIFSEAQRRLNLLEKEQFYTGNHDLGFMMFCSFGNAYRITKNEDYKSIIFNAAKSLSTRYRPTIQAIQSWDSSSNFKCPVIIDNMMNLELLEWVSQNGGNKDYSKIANTHAITTLKNHFRSDYSSYHVVDYDLATGNVLRKVTWQGNADSSAWARGQAWGLYGYTMMYRFTKNDLYLSQAKHIAHYILSHPNLPEDMVPYWDFDAPDIPTAYRDASAAAIIASALLELGQYVPGEERLQYVQAAEKMIRSLASPRYRAATETNGGFILLHSVGGKPFNSEVDVPLTYADYYFIEALARYKQWYL